MTKPKNTLSNQGYYNIIKINKIFILVALGFLMLLVPGQNIYTSDEKVLFPENQVQIKAPIIYPYPVNKTGNSPSQDFSASGIIIRDINSGVFLYKLNSEELLSPASTTKLLTALVILDTFKLDDVMTVKNLVSDGQMMGLILGEKITVENLLYGTLIHSGNDAAYVLADNYPGGVDAFVVKMNEKAAGLGLTKSHFTNPIGYDDPNHKMTPLDLSLLASAAVNNKTIAKMVAIPAITISDVTHTQFHSLKNVNQLLGKIPGVGGIKTGWTEAAGENLVTLVERNGHRVILVVLRSRDRFGETARLIDWVFNNFEWQEYSPAAN
jgi:serine-type D-Ala-D-Ala carboxypeptidase (penicillin-binding protein 5/6)